MRSFQITFSKIVWKLYKQRPLARVSYRQSGPTGYRKTRALIPLCNAPKSVLCRLGRYRQSRIITILGRPPGITCMSQDTRYAGGIVITLEQFSMEPTKNIYIQQRLTESRVQKIHYKDPITTEANSIRVRIRVQMGLRVLKITMTP